MHIAFINPQGNFDPEDSYWTEHPDFGGQLVYVKEVAIAMAALGYKVDILTRRVLDPDWPEFEGAQDHYPGVENVRILRLPCGPESFLPKEELWPYLGSEWVPNIIAFYHGEGRMPDALTTHYADGGLSGALLKKKTGIAFTFTGHSLGAQKMDKLGVTPDNLAQVDARFHFARRIPAERVGMNHAARIITSTNQERLEQYAHPAYQDAVHPGDDTHFAVVPPGVNRRIFSPSPGPEDASITHRIEAALARDIDAERRSLPLAMASSRLEGKKNHLGLVQAFAHSRDLQVNANLAIVVRGLDDPLRNYQALSPGERAIMDDITAMLTWHGLWGKVTAFPLNSQVELAAAYRYLASHNSVFALTALYEPFGLAPLEAISCGLPAVVTANGGPSESLREGEREFGVLVDPSDPDDIAHGLLRLLGSLESWTRFQEAGMQRVLSRYTWERTAQGYLGVIQSMLGESDRVGELPIPEYFTQPTPENDISPSELSALYFRLTRSLNQ